MLFIVVCDLRVTSDLGIVHSSVTHSLIPYSMRVSVTPSVLYYSTIITKDNSIVAIYNYYSCYTECKHVFV